MNETENKTTTKSNSTKIIAGLVALLALLFGVWHFVHNRNQVDTHNANTENVMPDFNSSGNGSVAWNAGATQQAAQPSINKAQDQTAPTGLDRSGEVDTHDANTENVMPDFSSSGNGDVAWNAGITQQTNQPSVGTVQDQTALVPPVVAAPQKASVLFYFDSTELKEGQMVKIEEFIKKIPNGYQGDILVEGYTCDIGEDAYNKDLSLKRANAIADLLREQGFQNTKVIPYGESAYPAQQGPARYQYRKVDISVN